MEISQRISSLQDARHSAVKRMREVLDSADADGGRELTAEERTEYDRLEADVEHHGERIAAEIKLRNIEVEMETRDGNGREFQTTTVADDRGGFDSDEYNQAFAQYLVRGG